MAPTERPSSGIICLDATMRSSLPGARPTTLLGGQEPAAPFSPDHCFTALFESSLITVSFARHR